VLGGADFGAGLWDLLAGTTQRGRRPRTLIDASITPVWEANHVWLIFDLVIFWTAFPQAFTAVLNTLALPLWLALAGIVLRGAGFGFRKELCRLNAEWAAGATFAFSSLLTPFFMGTVVGAIAAGAVPAGASHASLTAWTSPTALLAGFLFVAACGYLAAVYLVGEADRRGDRRMRAYFTRRARSPPSWPGSCRWRPWPNCTPPAPRSTPGSPAEHYRWWSSPVSAASRSSPCSSRGG
jgi:cytochrome d ubiquinol oxidase subunit II